MKTLNENFKALTLGSQFLAGTNSKIREAVMNELTLAYPEVLKLEIKGVYIELAMNSSLSGKTKHYCSSITTEQYIGITGDSFGLKKDTVKNSPYIQVQPDGSIEIHGGGNHFEKLSNNSCIELK